jgi:outer membrane protein assembly factor BamB
VLSESSIFLTAERDRSLIVLCLERSSGEPKWERAIQAGRKEPRHTLNHAASSTPVTDGENVYAFFGDYGLVSYDSLGEERWSVPLGPFTIGWGPGSSPVLVDDAIVIPLDGYVDSHIAAFESKTGKLRWRKEREPLSHNYSTPIVRSASGACEIVVLGPNKLVAYDSRDGRERWTAKVPGGSIVSTPALHEDVFVSANFAVDSYPPFSDYLKTNDSNGNGSLEPGEFGRLDAVLTQVAQHIGDKDGKISEAEWIKAYGDLSAGVVGRPAVTALRLRTDAGGNTTATPAWEEFRSVPNVPSPLIFEGILYLVANGVVMTAVLPKSGEITKRARVTGLAGNCYASPVAADGKLVIVSEEGNTAVIQAGRNWETLSVGSLDDGCYATPALADGRVLIRTMGSLACFGKRRGFV